MLKRIPMIWLTFAILAATPALGADGVVEINQAAAEAGRIWLGDAPGFPVTLSEPGSYRLTSNLDLRNLPSPEDVTAIEITGAGVLLDLGGFSIIAGSDCEGAPPSSSGTGDGVYADSSAGHVRVENGFVNAVGRDGLALGDSAHVGNVTATCNGRNGISVGNHANVVNSRADANGASGVVAGPESRVVDNTGSNNAAFGLQLGSNSATGGNAWFANNGGSEGPQIGAAAPSIPLGDDACGTGTSCDLCGDGVIGGAEACDGANLGGTVCTDLPGFIGGTLACDAGCAVFDTSGCQSPVCGDGVAEGLEACDDGYTDACGSCDATCTGPGAGSVCGDNQLCPETEECDDGGTDPGDGCSAVCTIEP